MVSSIAESNDKKESFRVSERTFLAAAKLVREGDHFWLWGDNFW